MSKGKRKQIIIYIIVAAVLLIAAYPKVRPMLQSSPPAGNPAQQRGPQALNVQAVVLEPQQLTEMINSTGTLISDEETDLAFEASGRITDIYFTEGLHVRKGDLMAKVNDRHLQAQLQRLKAQKQLVEDREFRQRSLLEREAISQEAYDQAVTELQVIEADIALVEARIAETELRAPFDGIVGLRYLSEGAYVSPNTKIARLVKNRPLKLEFSVPERYSGQIGKGFPVNFRIDGVQNSFTATVYAIEPKIEVGTRTIVVRALYPNENEELRPGRFAGITLQMSHTDSAVAIPTEAVIPQMEGERVFVYRSGRAETVNVTTGLRTESHIEITGGLQFGDTLLTSGVMQLRPGMPVDVYQFNEN